MPVICTVSKDKNVTNGHRAVQVAFMTGDMGDSLHPLTHWNSREGFELLPFQTPLEYQLRQMDYYYNNYIFKKKALCFLPA